MANSTGVCPSRWAGHSAVGIASAALLVQRSEWIDSDWDIVYEGSSVNLSLSDVHRSTVGRSVSSDAEARRIEARAVAKNCSVQVLPCTDCGTLTVGKDGGTFDTIITNASIVDDPNHCRETDDENYCRGDLTYDTATGLVFFFWSVRTGNNSRERRIATKGIEVLLTDEEIDRVLTTNETVWEIFPGRERSRLYSISCESNGLHWTDLTRAVSIYRTVQMESPGEKKVNVNGDLANVRSLTREDVMKSVFALKAEDISSNCEGLLPHYTQCGTFDVSKASILIAVNSFTVLLYIALRIAAYRKKHAGFPISTSSWKKYATGTLQRNTDFIIAVETESSARRLVAIDVSKQASDTLS
ncbi:hypothetical protein FGB62_193g037 [Gracilaria domingensis]|nr:hypothetical protein FGB62_193g037 [Gracilaria domingensis]